MRKDMSFFMKYFYNLYSLTARYAMYTTSGSMDLAELFFYNVYKRVSIGDYYRNYRLK